MFAGCVIIIIFAIELQTALKRLVGSMIMRKFIILQIAVTVLCLMVCGCGSDGHDSRLSDIALRVDTAPRAALAALDSIDPAGLSGADRHYYDFLSLKAADKAYITHKSDSLILTLLDYYAEGDELYPEVLYYAGRVYSDLGDMPTALRYFNRALDNVPDNPDNYRLRMRIVSQTGRLLATLRLYDQAQGYLEESLRLDSLLDDPLATMYDLQLLGDIYLRSKQYDKAKTYFKSARKLAEKVSHIDIATQDMYLAIITYYQGNPRRAVNQMMPVLDKLDTLIIPQALSYTINMYLDLDKTDSAYILSQRLIHEKIDYNKITGYRFALSPKLINFNHQDSIPQMIETYRKIVEKYLDQNSNREALIQNANYNYSNHQKARTKAEESNHILKQWLYITIIVILIIIIVILYSRQRYKTKLLRLRAELDNIRSLRVMLNSQKDLSTDSVRESSSNLIEVSPSSQENSIKNLKRQLYAELSTICAKNEKEDAIPEQIINSKSYQEISSHLKNGNLISETNSIWNELEEVILELSPNFKYRLYLITGEKLSDTDYQMILLIKCGFSPTQIANLIGRSKSTITFRRKKFSKAFFDSESGSKNSSKQFDRIIRLL